MTAGILDAVVIANAAANFIIKAEHIAIGRVYEQIIVKIEVCTVFLHKNIDVFASTGAFQGVMCKINVSTIVIINCKSVAA